MALNRAERVDQGAGCVGTGFDFVDRVGVAMLLRRVVGRRAGRRNEESSAESNQVNVPYCRDAQQRELQRVYGVRCTVYLVLVPSNRSSASRWRRSTLTTRQYCVCTNSSGPSIICIERLESRQSR